MKTDEPTKVQQSDFFRVFGPPPGIWASPSSVFIGFQKITDLGYFYLYLQHILEASKYEKLMTP